MVIETIEDLYAEASDEMTRVNLELAYSLGQKDATKKCKEIIKEIFNTGIQELEEGD